MKNQVLFIFIALIFSSLQALNAQPAYSEGFAVQRSVTEVEVDSTLLGRNIFSVLPDDVVVVQPAQLRAAVDSLSRKSESTFNGFRIRLYIGSSPDARETSLSVLNKFSALYPNIQAYRSYTEPNFKVSVGNFRTRVDAEMALRRIQPDFPDAFIVRERFKYPSIGEPDFTGSTL